MKVFDDVPRYDKTRRAESEPEFAFLNRTGSVFFEPVREMFEMWVAALPFEHRASVIGQLRSGEDGKLESAFWELYLHQVVTGSGHEVEIHPNIPGTSKQPDFLVHADVPFYLEAVVVSARPERKARDRRLAQVQAILDEARVAGWSLSFDWYLIGPDPVKSTKLRDRLMRWLDGLDPEDVAWRLGRASDDDADAGCFLFLEEGWHLEFRALPTGVQDSPLVLMRGAGRAMGVDNATGVTRVLNRKANRYGRNLPHPLVTAVLSNTEARTKDFEFRSALYGDPFLPPNQIRDADLHTDAHWRTSRGWRRAHNPNVVSASWLTWRSLTKQLPRLWATAEPGISSVRPFSWADTADVSGPETPEPAKRPALTSLGIPADWCEGEPDFARRTST